MSTFLLLFTILSTALITGLFYGYSVSVNPGLHTLSNLEYLKAMQSINRAILNPYFFVSFIGTLILLPVNAYLHYQIFSPGALFLISAAAIVYIVGVFGVTVFVNVPLNEMLDKVNLASIGEAEQSDVRASFEGAWSRWHTVRTIGCIVSLVLLVVGVLTNKAGVC